ncbi:VOC family protein [Methylocaldum szegediense]|uniref:PhnB protein n=1 Tax=Methylocaldum szegediense TaxID=73780 RepID=A0ABM9I7E0_9GAMM|nr:VOC family protein [Methylocaldum szegediense]CAI8937094.1 PhnB protein [Methylocaldum szegediense]
MHIQPYLFFEGRCKEALDFYQRALGAEVTMLLRNKESPEPPACPLPPGAEEKILHSSFRIGNSTVYASDGLCQGQPNFQGFSLSLSAPNETEAARLFNTLAEGGQVQMPLGKTFFSPCFGMVTDRFGVAWMIVVVESAG